MKNSRLQKFGTPVNEASGSYYSLTEIKQLEGEIQQAINKVIDKYEPLINAAIEKQIDPRHKFYAAMGTAAVEDENGDNIHFGPAYDFCKHVLLLQYRDKFDTAMDIKEVRTGR